MHRQTGDFKGFLLHSPLIKHSAAKGEVLVAVTSPTDEYATGGEPWAVRRRKWAPLSNFNVNPVDQCCSVSRAESAPVEMLFAQATRCWTNKPRSSVFFYFRKYLPFHLKINQINNRASDIMNNPLIPLLKIIFKKKYLLIWLIITTISRVHKIYFFVVVITTYLFRSSSTRSYRGSKNVFPF